MLCPARRWPWSNSPCHAVRPEIGRLAPTVKSTSPGSGARLRASIATYSASVPSRCQSARPSTRCPTDTPVVPYPRAATTPASSCPGMRGVRSRSRRSVQVEGHAISVGTNPDVVTDQAAGTAGMTLVDQPEPPAALNDVIVQVHAAEIDPRFDPRVLQQHVLPRLFRDLSASDA